MSITLSESAATRVKDFLAERGHGLGIRLGVKPSGCSGFSYILEFVDQVEDTDVSYEQHGVTVVVDKKSLVYLDGVHLDYVVRGLNEGFEYINPNMKSECGCGESFNV